MCSSRMCLSHLFCLRGDTPLMYNCPPEPGLLGIGVERSSIGGRVVNESAPLVHMPVFFREKGCTRSDLEHAI